MTGRMLWGILVVAVGLMACGDDEAVPGPYDSAFLGIWTIDSWTENLAGCDAEGESILERSGNSKVLVQACTFNLGFSVDFLQALECVDEADCESKRCRENSLNLSGATFESGNDGDGWRGKATFATGGADDQCSGQVITHTLSADGDDLVLRQEIVDPGPFGQDAEGFCDTDAAEMAARGKPCIALEVRRLSR